MSFFGELRRRNVVRVGIAYLVVAWLVSQVVDVVNEPLNLPDWFATVVILLLAIGFPFALILSWAYELTPQGVVRADKVPLSESITHVTRARMYRRPWWLKNSERFFPTPWRYCHLGTTAQILTTSTMLPVFTRRSARTSVEQYKDTVKSIPEIARELNVETVMEGSVRYADGRIRITTQLNDGVTGANLWSETYQPTRPKPGGFAAAIRKTTVSDLA